MNDNEATTSSTDWQAGSLPSNSLGEICFRNHDKQEPPAIKLCLNGDIYVHGRLAENDKEVVNGMRVFLQCHFNVK